MLSFKDMKKDTHPNYYQKAAVKCVCGNTFTTASSLPAIRVEIFSKCHPLFSGTQKFVDTLGQVDRFVKKTESSKIKQEERKKILEARKSRVEKRKEDRPSLKDLLMQARKQIPS